MEVTGNSELNSLVPFIVTFISNVTRCQEKSILIIVLAPLEQNNLQNAEAYTLITHTKM